MHGCHFINFVYMNADRYYTISVLWTIMCVVWVYISWRNMHQTRVDIAGCTWLYMWCVWAHHVYSLQYLLYIVWFRQWYQCTMLYSIHRSVNNVTGRVLVCYTFFFESGQWDQPWRKWNRFQKRTGWASPSGQTHTWHLIGGDTGRSGRRRVDYLQEWMHTIGKYHPSTNRWV